MIAKFEVDTKKRKKYVKVLKLRFRQPWIQKPFME